jgi:hypothetical protein
MGEVINLGGTPRGTGEDPYIDAHSLLLLRIVLADLRAHRVNEPFASRAAQFRKTETKLNSILARFEPPQGAA